LAYEFYWNGKQGEEHLIGILPERRRNPKRISDKSVMKWVRQVLGNAADRRGFPTTDTLLIDEPCGGFFNETREI